MVESGRDVNLTLLSSRKSKFLLAVDSNVDNLCYLSLLLQRFNYRFFKAMTAKEALESMATAVPALILTALNLRDMSGFEFIEEIKKNPGTARIPVIALSQQADLNVKKRCFSLGATVCLFQPVDAERLYQAIQAALEKCPRTSMRVRTVQPVKVNNMPPEDLGGVYTLELSERGMFLRTTKPAALNTRLSLQIDLNGHKVPVEAAVLYRCQKEGGPYQEPGMGLGFVRITPKNQEFIRRFVKTEVMRGITPANA